MTACVGSQCKLLIFLKIDTMLDLCVTFLNKYKKLVNIL